MSETVTPGAEELRKQARNALLRIEQIVALPLRLERRDATGSSIFIISSNVGLKLVTTLGGEYSDEQESEAVAALVELANAAPAILSEIDWVRAQCERLRAENERLLLLVALHEQHELEG